MCIYIYFTCSGEYIPCISDAVAPLENDNILCMYYAVTTDYKLSCTSTIYKVDRFVMIDLHMRFAATTIHLPLVEEKVSLTSQHLINRCRVNVCITYVDPFMVAQPSENSIMTTPLVGAAIIIVKKNELLKMGYIPRYTHIFRGYGYQSSTHIPRCSMVHYNGLQGVCCRFFCILPP